MVLSVLSLSSIAVSPKIGSIHRVPGISPDYTDLSCTLLNAGIEY